MPQHGARLSRPSLVAGRSWLLLLFVVSSRGSALWRFSSVTWLMLIKLDYQSTAPLHFQRIGTECLSASSSAF